jgi:glycosyltransferase involved in cell wall biosynthesis
MEGGYSVSKVSIYMPSYNHAKFLCEAIDSVLNQTFSNYELFIVDDASTDQSWSIIQSYKDPRIHSFRNDINRNDKWVMRKVIFEIATGGYIAIINSDDIWEPKKLQKQVDFLDSHPGIGVVFTRAMIIGENGEPFEDKSHFYYNIFDQPNRSRYEWLKYFFYKGNALCHTSILIRKSVYDNCGFYRNAFLQIADYDLWVRVCQKYEIYVIPEKLTRFRVRLNQMNVSGIRLDTRIRHQFEKLQLLDNFSKITKFRELVKIFPNAQKYYREDGSDIGYVLGMLSLNSSRPVNQLFGLELLFNAINDPVRSKKINSLYGFSKNDFVKLTAKYDVFSIEEKDNLLSQINDLTAQLRVITNSKKWKITIILARISALVAPKTSLRYRILSKLYRVIVYPIGVIRKNRKIRKDVLLIGSSGYFDEPWYLTNNPDIAEKKITPCKHYLLYGGFEGRDPGPKFSSGWYLEVNTDVKNNRVNPLLHYLKYGKSEGRSAKNVEHAEK